MPGSHSSATVATFTSAMSFARSFRCASVLLCISMVLVLPTDARTLRQMAASAAASIAAGSSLQPRRMLTGRVPPTDVVAPLPADAFVTASPCKAGLTAGSKTSVTFTVSASTGIEVFREVALQVDFPKPLWATGVSLTCKDSSAQEIICDAPSFTADDLQYDILSTACMLGDLVQTGAVSCTFSYTVPTEPLAATAGAGPGNQILGAITFADLASNVVENSLNNAAATCA